MWWSFWISWRKKTQESLSTSSLSVHFQRTYLPLWKHCWNHYRQWLRSQRCYFRTPLTSWNSPNPNFTIQFTSKWSCRTRTLYHLRSYHQSMWWKYFKMARSCSSCILCWLSHSQKSYWIFAMLSSLWSQPSSSPWPIRSHISVGLYRNVRVIDLNVSVGITNPRRLNLIFIYIFYK